MRRFLPVVLLLPIVLLTAACERTPVGPTDVNAELVTLLGAAAGDAAPLTLPGLLQSAVRSVFTEQGPGAARVLVRELRRLQLEPEGADGTQGDATAARARAQRQEELRIVTRVFGEEVAGRVLDAVVSDAGELQVAVEEALASGTPLARSRGLLAQVAELVADGTVAWQHGAVAPALDMATHAAALNEDVRRELTAAARVDGLDELFAAAVERYGAVAGATALASLLSRRDELEDTAAAAVRSGDARAAHAALEALRFAGIQVVVDVLGAESVGVLLAEATERTGQVTGALRRGRAAGRDMLRVERMAGTARDLLMRAEAAYAAGEAAAALDLGGHAVTLVNAVSLALAGK